MLMTLSSKLPWLRAAYFRELGVLLAGAAAGGVLAWYLHGFAWGDAGELKAAREAGIVSLSVLAGYPKSRDVYNYLLALGLPILLAMSAWWPARRWSSLGEKALGNGFSGHVYSLRSWLLLTGAIGLASWYAPATMTVGWNSTAAAWPLLGEEGATLAWVNRLSEGGVFGRDFFSLYGPMFVYPLSWLMDLIGDHSALIERYYKFVLQMIAFALLTLILLRTLRTRSLAWGMALAVAAAYPALLYPGANANVLRVALPLFALLCLALWVDQRRGRWRWVGGLVLGQSFLFAQEAAICALGAASVMLFLDARWRGLRYRDAWCSVLVLWAIVLLSMAPMMSYLLANGAGPATLDSLIGYPREVMLGFGARRFPSLRNWLHDDFRYLWIHYAVISVYVGSAIALSVIWAKGGRSPRLLWGIGLTVFGVLLFRQALGRSENQQTIKVMLPALLLSALWLEECWQQLRSWVAAPTAAVAGGVFGALVLVNLLFGIGGDPHVKRALSTCWDHAISFGTKFQFVPPLSEYPVHPRVGFPLDPETQRSVTEIGAFLDRYTAPKESVYFFPNEAAYYHLFDRPSPTRYVISYFATSFARQREVIRDLETTRPRFVVVSKNTWRVDNIAETVQVPLIVDYLQRTYRLGLSLDSVDIHVRR